MTAQSRQLSVNVVFSEHALEETARHAGELGGVRDIAVRATQYFVQVMSFEAYCGVGARLLQRWQRDFEFVWLGPSGTWPSQAQIALRDIRWLRQDRRTVHTVLQFPNVSGPGVRQQCFPGLTRETGESCG